MSSFAILGVTGSTGQEITKYLLKSPSDKINIYVRSRSKLRAIFPGIDSKENVTIFEGKIEDVELIERCVSGTRAVFSCVAASDNVPGLRIAQDTAQVIVAAFSQIRTRNPNAKLPKLIVMSSGSVNPKFAAEQPKIVHWLLWHGLSNIYTDLEQAEWYLRLQKGWLNVTFIQPGGLVHDVQKGYALSTERCGGTFLSFADLSAGMIDIARMESDHYAWKGVAVVPTNSDVKIPYGSALALGKGLTWWMLPWLYWVCKYLGLV
jgi:putative NADH-flavin reductase